MKLFNLVKRLTHYFKKFISPKQIDEESRRKELILNILLTFSTFSFLVINIIRVFDYITHPQSRGLPLSVTLAIMLFFIFLFWLNRRGWVKVSASLLVIVFSLPMFYSFLIWGADLPAAILLAVLVITLSGILLGARIAFLSTFFIAIFLIVVTDYQDKGVIAVQSYWRSEPAQIGDAITYAVLLLIIAAIAWLFCTEINRSLKRARTSELLLREERDLLEIKVEKRTQELREAEAEKINSLYRFAEFGRLSSGIFHDLINPLTAVSLNLEQIKAETDVKILSAKSYLNQALLATGRMESLIASIKKQIAQEGNISLFSLNQEIEQIIQILSYKARRAQTKLNFYTSREIELEGDAVKFGQIIINLLANAIEACEDTGIKEVIINLSDTEEIIKITVEDSGAGITPENITKIFTPFFSTKNKSGHGLGIGLASTKSIIEKDFHGYINVTSKVNRGTIFTINLPK
jgi:signal transduction histidine kinase